MKTHQPRPLRFVGCALAAATVILVTSGCGLFARSHYHRSSSVVSFLFPKEQPPPQQAGLPVLQLPLRVGLAFVPDEAGRGTRFSQTQRQVLLGRIAAEFRSLPFVQSIQTVPELYLRPGGGFSNLDQLRGLLGVDVIVLLSYDQAQFSTENRRSIAYWTIVGAYFVAGNQNDTHTMMEATVYDIPSRTLLFHAPGVDLTKATSSLVYAEKELRGDSAGSLDRAAADLVKNLQAELTTFRQTVKEGKANVKIEHKPGYSGGGALDGVTLGAGAVLLGAGALAARRANRKSTPPRTDSAWGRDALVAFPRQLFRRSAPGRGRPSSTRKSSDVSR